MTQVSPLKVNQCLNIVSVGSGASMPLKTKNDEGQDIKMPRIYYSPYQWSWLYSAQKSSMQKCCA